MPTTRANEIRAPIGVDESLLRAEQPFWPRAFATVAGKATTRRLQVPAKGKLVIV
jgi:hypothetical protein